jgi:tryptophan synthase alpha subunit
MADFTAAAKEAGVDGLIVPNLPYAATYDLRSEAMKNNLELVGPFAIHQFFIPFLPLPSR